MNHATPSFFRFALVLLLGVSLSACDESPTSVEDFTIQPNMETPSDFTLVVAGENAGTTFDVGYQGLSSAPQATATGNLALEKINETGSPTQGGAQQWRVTYNAALEGVVQEQVIIQAASPDRQITDTLTVTVSPFVIETQFESTFAAVADYEDDQRSMTVTGGTMAEITSESVADGSNGANALKVTSGGSGSVVISRQASGPQSDRFSFLLQNTTGSSFDLTITFTEEAAGGEITHDFTFPIPADNQWRRYAVGFSQVSPDFNPVAQRAGGDGPLLSVELSTNTQASFYIDELALSSPNATRVEIDDFERTTNAYGSFSAIQFENTTEVADMADGPTARSLSYTTGGNFFGYNYELLSVSATADDVLTMRIGEVSRNFVLFAFVETFDSAGGYTFDAGIEVPISAGNDWRTVEIPLGQLGESPAALAEPGIRNVGFEVRRAADDATTEPIEFLIDGISLQAGGE
ncbi:hypothetical protein [Salisaeta longa]|uniref:hypothetical protein n=1 Tax=Salisaeta longa TaxID=503170 RepID=UPI00048DE410|nr:hypothetical protein [Salisaeta longa]